MNARLKKYISLFAFLILLQQVHADWITVNAGITENLLSVSSYETNGLIVGTKNIYLTKTGGKTASSWSLYTPAGPDAALFRQCKFYSGSQIFGNDIVYICGEDSINHTAVIFSISFTDNSLALEYTGPTGSRLNSIVYNYMTVYAVGNNGLLVQKQAKENSQTTDHTYHTVSTGTTQHLNQIILNGNYYYIAGDEVLISHDVLYDVTKTNAAPDLKFLSIAKSSYGSFLMAVTANAVYNVNANLTYSIDTLYDAPGLKPTSISLSEYGEYISSRNGIYFQKSNTNYFEYMPSSNNGNFNFMRFQGDLYSGFAVGQHGLIAYNTDNGGPTKPYARITIMGGCTNEYITYSGEPGGASDISWYANGVYQSSSATWFAKFTTPGQYNIRFISSNSLYADTVYQTIYIADKPNINLVTSVSDNILCKSEQTVITIANTQPDNTYQLRTKTSGSVFGSVNSTGTTAVMTTAYINSTGNYFIRAIHNQSGCLADFTTIIPIQVEHTKARFTSSEINASANAQVLLTNNSYESTTAKWTITNGANIVHSTAFSPQVSFSIPGNTLIKLVATSANNCADSVTAAGPMIVEEPANDACWMLQWSPMTQTTPQPVIKDIKEYTDGFIVAGQYLNQSFPSHAGASFKSHPYGGGYVAKYSHAGVLKWISYTLDSTGSYNAPFNSVCIAPNGNIYAIGSVRYKSYIFDASGDSISCGYGITNGGGDISVIICYSPEGKILWLKQINFMPKSVTADNAGNMILSGSYSTAYPFFRTFQLATPTSITTLPYIDNSVFTDNSIQDVSGSYMLKLDPTGEFLWYVLLPYITDRDFPISIDSQDNIFYSSMCQGYGGLISTNNNQAKLLRANPTTDGTTNNLFGFTAKYSPDGSLLWITRMQDTRYYGSTYFSNTKIIGDHLYITGETSGNLDYKILQPDNSIIDIHTSASFMMKIDNNGFYEWLSTTDDAGNGFHTGKGLQFYKSTISNDSITVLAYIQANDDGNIISATGSMIPYNANSAFAFINYDHDGNILSYQVLGENDSYYHIIESGSYFFYSSKSNSIYLGTNIQINPPYNMLEKTFTETYNHFIYKISNDRCAVPPVTTGLTPAINQETQGLTVYPNPVNESSVVYIGKEGTTKKIIVFDVTGKVIASTQTDKASYPLRTLLAQSIPGMYVVQVSYENQVLTSRIIKID